MPGHKKRFDIIVLGEDGSEDVHVIGFHHSWGAFVAYLSTNCEELGEKEVQRILDCIGNLDACRSVREFTIDPNDVSDCDMLLRVETLY